MKILTVVGARPQFIKSAPLSRELRKNHTEILLHTGQHYDPEMSDVFFDELNIPNPDYHLTIGSGPHGKQTGECLTKIEEILFIEKPDLVLVYGDTNSTLAGTLAAVKLHIPVAHVEAGLRSFDREMPEEVNRVLVDHVSSLLFCPTKTAVNNLKKEGINTGVFLTGDVMVDALKDNAAVAEKKSGILYKYNLKPGQYLVLTIHRPSNSDNPSYLANILGAISDSGIPTVFPIHPRTKKNLILFDIWHKMPVNLIICDPLGYLDMIMIMRHALKILTDSGGIQKEAYILHVPCITLRNNTEWVETASAGWNTLAGSDRSTIVKVIHACIPDRTHPELFGSDASAKITKIITQHIHGT